ncbi:MAG: decaprenyl-phosphate phosphoribosyltransferase, partial [Chloroflexi bacterium]|nr:decaprenyl-phosphate phosphoribosyltransferase [Chloroflexota bacterium]
MFRSLLQAMRPKQWAKNVFVFAGVFFDGRILDVRRIAASMAAFALFCLLSGAVYLINDLADLERDRVHPEKRHRPLASGALPPRAAWLATVVILGVGLPLSFLLKPAFGAVALLYVAMMLAYSFYLKNLVIIDVMVIAAGFVLRVFAGTIVVAVTRFSPWLYVCTTLLALFIAINKRRHELLLLAEKANDHRSSLQEYSPRFLDDMTSLVVATLLSAYSLYTFSAPNLPANHSMMLTIPFVMYGIFRY